MAIFNINSFLKKYNITQKDLADATGINRNTISRYCNNSFETIGKNHIDLIVNFFKCEIEDMISIGEDSIVNYPNELIKNMIELNMQSSIKSANSELCKEECTYDNHKKKLISTKKLKINNAVNIFLTNLIEYILKSVKNETSLYKIDINNYLESYKKYDSLGNSIEVKINIKLGKYYTIMNSFLNEHLDISDNTLFLDLLVLIYSIYTHGGLQLYSDADLDEIYVNLEYCIKKISIIN